MRRRNGFTITELLIAMALIVFIMYILADAFSSASSTFRNLKAVSDMNEKLRASSQTLRRLLQADHFDGKRRVSDPDFWKYGPPTEGFLRIYNGTPLSTNNPAAPYAFEGTDLDGNPSFRAVDHGLHFAVKLRGNNLNEYFQASVPGNSPLLALPLQDARLQTVGGTSLNSPWAEVAVFMRDSGDFADDPEDPGLPAQKLYTLYLRQRLLIYDNALVPAKEPVGNFAGYGEVSCYADPTSAGNLYFNGPADVTMPARRLGNQANGVSGGLPSQTAGPMPVNVYPALSEDAPQLAGGDVLLTNVLSFEVRVLVDRSQWVADPNVPNGNYDFVPLSHVAVQQFANGNPNFTANAGPRVFDTWSASRDDAFDYSAWATGGAATSVPLYQNANGQRIRITAIQITMRIWDSNTRQTRQTSVVVEM